jgi:chemotaxis protein MotB
VDPKGVDALHKLSSVLKKDPDIHVMVEGHTDDVPLHGTGAMKDNWDLSVLRATSITRILADDGVAPQQITAAGRSKFVPVAGNDTPEGRALNRRTEIILTPKLDELFKILETD